MSETFKGIEYHSKVCLLSWISEVVVIGSTRHAFLLLETIFLDGKVAPPHEDVA